MSVLPTIRPVRRPRKHVKVGPKIVNSEARVRPEEVTNDRLPERREGGDLITAGFSVPSNLSLYLNMPGGHGCNNQLERRFECHPCVILTLKWARDGVKRIRQ